MCDKSYALMNGHGEMNGYKNGHTCPNGHTKAKKVPKIDCDW